MVMLCAGRRLRQLQNRDAPEEENLPINDYRSPITYYLLPITHYPLPIPQSL
jgi:hypothetical protein